MGPLSVGGLLLALNPLSGNDPDVRASLLSTTGRLLGDEFDPTGLRLGDDPEIDARGLCALLCCPTLRSPLIEAVGPDSLDDGSGPGATGRSARLEVPVSDRLPDGGALDIEPRVPRSLVVRLREPMPHVPLEVARSYELRLWIA